MDIDQRHQTIRVRHDLRRRTVTVESVTRLSPHMLRVTFTSPELHDFVSASFDDHIKLFFPVPEGMPAMRDFTPRSFDNKAGSLVVDFALHESGPATLWAAAAKPGDTLQTGGPRGSTVVPDDFDWVLLIGDDTALPAIGRRIEEARPGSVVASFVITTDGTAHRLDTQASWTPHWLTRHAGFDDAELLHAALADHSLPDGDGFVWIAAEASVARHLRGYMVEQRGHPRAWTKAAGCWKHGVADAHEKIED